MKKIIKASFFKKIVLPAFLAILLFILSVFIFIIPTFENNAILQKQNMLNELTNTAWSILNKYHKDYENKILTFKEAQTKAISEIEALRYGKDKKDYFWLTDLSPVMVMHPYFKELNGKSLENFADPDGTKLFIEAVNIAKSSGEGFIRYKWQFKDDSTHIVPKLSFIKKFSPWNWIVGTGIYLDDIQSEISSLTNKLLLILLAISIIITLIIFFITYQSLAIENRRREVEEQLRESREKYKSLLESTTEGIILLLNSKISYANNFIQNWLDYSIIELQNQNIFELFQTKKEIHFNEIQKETKLEIELIKKDKSRTEAILTILPIKFADKEGLLLTFKDVAEHRTIKTELEYFRTQLKNIYRFSDIAFFRFSLKGKSRLMEFNKKLIEILGYDSEFELKNTPMVNILSDKIELKNLLKGLNEKGEVLKKQIALRKKDGTSVNINMNLILTELNNNENKYCDGFIEVKDQANSFKEINDLSLQIAKVVSDNNQKIINSISPIVSCKTDTSFNNLIDILISKKSTYILPMINNNVLGIITLDDIVRRGNFANNNQNIIASDIMTSPVIYINESATIEKAVTIFKNKEVSHLIIKNLTGKLIGVLEKKMILGKYINFEELLSELINELKNPTELLLIRKQLPQFIKPLINELGNVEIVTKIISKFNDRITRIIIDYSIKEQGEPPVNFAFITLGSAGREELVFNSDQDNAIIYENPIDENSENVQKYFLELANKINKQLDLTGLPTCPGDYMASNIKWCQPLSVWKDYFNDWIVNAEPLNIMNISVFFDARKVYGDTSLFEELENYIYEILKGRTAFFYFLAQAATNFKPPLNLFGNIVTESSGKNIETIDLKNSIAQIVMFTRTYALYQGIREKGTIQRLNALKEKETLSEQTITEVSYHYNFLMHKRLENQITQIQSNSELNNYINPKKNSELEQMILKKVFTQMNSYQEKLSAEFMSAYKG